MSIVIEPGTYEGTIKSATIFEAKSGAVMFSALFDFNGIELKGGICLIQKDGTLSERGFRDVKMLYGWTDWDWSRFDVEPEQLAGPVASCVIETVQGEKGEWSSIKYINVGDTLTRCDAKSLASKYGAKTRALFGGVPAPAKAPAAKPVAKPAAPKPPVPPKVLAPVSTMEECWEKFCAANSDKTEVELYDLWAQEIQKQTGKEQNDCTPEDWGKLNAAILPM